ncbi:MAG: MATE family efflux transporter, partial [Verrucomicrobiae bacterium]|nr:MATE family efflux transporter [Verrucomicrobiae bacterium]
MILATESQSQAIRKDSQYSRMVEGPISKVILSLAIPSVLSMLVSSIYNMADTYFVGKLGTSASGAVGIVFPIM